MMSIGESLVAICLRLIALAGAYKMLLRTLDIIVVRWRQA